MKEEALSPREEAFCVVYIECGVASDAYRQTHNVGATTKQSTIWQAASKIMARPKVRERIAELREVARAISAYTVADAAKELEDARKLAMTVLSPAAAVSATTAKMKLFGLEAPTRSRMEVTGKDGGAIKTEATGDAAARLAALVEQLAGRAAG